MNSRGYGVRTEFELLSVAEPLESQVRVSDRHTAGLEVSVLHLYDIGRSSQRHGEDGFLEVLHRLRPLLRCSFLQGLQLRHRCRVLSIQDDAGLRC